MLNLFKVIICEALFFTKVRGKNIHYPDLAQTLATSTLLQFNALFPSKKYEEHFHTLISVSNYNLVIN